MQHLFQLGHVGIRNGDCSGITGEVLILNGDRVAHPALRMPGRKGLHRLIILAVECNQAGQIGQVFQRLTIRPGQVGNGELTGIGGNAEALKGNVPKNLAVRKFLRQLPEVLQGERLSP